jgi:VanZ family protein
MVALSPVLARFLLIAAALVCAIGMVGPFQGVEKTLITPDKAAHFVAFYGLTILMIASFPKRRSLDLGCLAIFMGVSLEVAQLLSGRDAELGDILADSAGVIAVLAPMYLQGLRSPRAFERRRRLTETLPLPEAPGRTEVA